MSVDISEDNGGTIVIKDIHTNGRNLLTTISSRNMIWNIATNCSHVTSEQLSGLHEIAQRLSELGINPVAINNYSSIMKVIT